MKSAKVSFLNNILSENPEDLKFDFQTPKEVARYMVSLLPKEINHVLEPTQGLGNITSALVDAGKKVTAPHDYFLLDRSDRFPAVVMNPPFSRKFTFTENAPDSISEKGMKMGYWFLVDCMKRSDLVIALMPWYTISDSDVRLRMLYRYGLKSLTALPRKTFQYARIQTVVIELQNGFKGETVFRAFDCLQDDLCPKLF